MRKSASFLVLVLLTVSSAFAQQKNNISVFLTNPSGWRSSSAGNHLEGGVGIAMSHAFSPAFSIEASISRESYTLYRPFPDGSFRFESVGVHTNPFDFTARYHFLTDSRWKPYIGGGLRYVSTHEIGRGSFSGYTLRRVDPEISGGVLFQLRPHLGIVFDAKQLIGNNDLRSDPAFKPSVGFHWRF